MLTLAETSFQAIYKAKGNQLKPSCWEGPDSPNPLALEVLGILWSPACELQKDIHWRMEPWNSLNQQPIRAALLMATNYPVTKRVLAPQGKYLERGVEWIWKKTMPRPYSFTAFFIKETFISETCWVGKKKQWDELRHYYFNLQYSWIMQVQ